MKNFQLCFLLWLFSKINISLEFAPRITVNGKWLVDDLGRVRIFHGFNSVLKREPWFDEQILNKSRLEIFKQCGFNVIRLGTMWSGVEPLRNKYNETYINILSQIVSTAEEFDFHVIMDMHQDVFSSNVCSTCYDGIPSWISTNFEPSVFKYPWPFTAISYENWALGYLTYSVSSGFQQFYDNVDGAADSFVRFWTKIAEKFKDYANVLGYELLNEPWAGNVYLDPFLLLPGVAGAKNLYPLYDRVVREISKIDNITNIFYEPVTWGVYSSGNSSGSGFEKVPGGDAFRNRSVLSYHYYCWLLLTKNNSAPYPWYTKAACETVFAPKLFEAVLLDINKTGGSSFLTEFGNCVPDGNPDSINTIECNLVMSRADKYLQSWTYWDSQFFTDKGEARMEVLKEFARPYARAVAGLPIKMSFDRTTKVFEFEYIADKQLQAPTEIFVPQLQYPDGFSVKITPGTSWNFNSTSSVLFLKHCSSTSSHVSVKIQPVYKPNQFSELPNRPIEIDTLNHRL